MRVTQIDTTRGVNLPAQIADPKAMVQMGDGEILLVLDQKGVLYAKRNGEWYRMTKYTFPKIEEPTGAADPAGPEATPEDQSAPEAPEDPEAEAGAQPMSLQGLADLPKPPAAE